MRQEQNAFQFCTAEPQCLGNNKNCPRTVSWLTSTSQARKQRRWAQKLPFFFPALEANWEHAEAERI